MADSGEADKEGTKEESKWIRSKSKRSRVWNYFGISRDGKEVKCDLCPLVLKKHPTTTNQWAHLAHVHNIKQDTENEEKASTSASVSSKKKCDQQSIEASFSKTNRDPLNVVLARLSALDR